MTIQVDLQGWQAPKAINIPTWQQLSRAASVPTYEAANWVKLLNPPTEYAFDEAKLLCPCSEDEWLAWVPDYGEIVLNIRDFC